MEYILDTHTHTVASGHAYSTIREMAQMASKKGLKLLGITEHAVKMPGTCQEFYFENLRVLPRQMYGVELLFGVELNILDSLGTVDMQEEMLKKMDVVVASLHTPCISPGTKDENTQAVVETMKNPYVNIIGHPDDSRYPLDYEVIVKSAKKYHVLLEVNNSSLTPGGIRTNALSNDREMLLLCKEHKVPIIVNSDAHFDEDVGNHQYAEQLLNSLDFPEELIMNKSVNKFRSFLNKNKIIESTLLY
jgi:putative hydrolase